MRRIKLFISAVLISSSMFAQDRFELNAVAKLGYFFPKNVTGTPYFPANSISPGGGIALSYKMLNNTIISLGFDVNYLSPEMFDYHQNQLDVKWHSVNIPFNVKQIIGSKIFISGGATLVKQIRGYYNNPITPNHNQKIPEFNWQTGIGYNFTKLRISVNYTQGFNEINKKIKLSSNEYFDVDMKYREIYLKAEYPIWHF